MQTCVCLPVRVFVFLPVRVFVFLLVRVFVFLPVRVCMCSGVSEACNSLLQQPFPSVSRDSTEMIEDPSMLSKCYRNVIEMLSKCYRNVIEMLSKCYRNVIEMLRQYSRRCFETFQNRVQFDSSCRTFQRRDSTRLCSLASVCPANGVTWCHVVSSE